MAQVTCYGYNAGGDGHISAWGDDSNPNAVRGVASGSVYPNPLAVADFSDGKGSFGVYRSFLPINTSTVPAGATISGATLWLHGSAYVDNAAQLTLVGSTQTGLTTLSPVDFSKIGSTPYASFMPLANQWRSITLNEVGIAAIVKGGVTKFAIRATSDLNGNGPSTYQSNLDAIDSAYPPYLVVTYTVGGGTAYTKSCSAVVSAVVVGNRKARKVSGSATSTTTTSKKDIKKIASSTGTVSTGANKKVSRIAWIVSNVEAFLASDNQIANILTSIHNIVKVIGDGISWL